MKANDSSFGALERFSFGRMSLAALDSPRYDVAGCGVRLTSVRTGFATAVTTRAGATFANGA